MRNLSQYLKGTVLCVGCAHLVALSHTVVIDQPTPALELPATSKLVPLSSSAMPGSVAFSGSTTIHAILVAQWVANADGDGHSGPSYQLLPVPLSAAQMPHFAGAPLKFITVSNGPAILAKATSPQIAKAFDARALGVVHVEGLYSIRAYTLGGRCARAGVAEVVDVDPVRVRYPGRPEPIDCPA